MEDRIMEVRKAEALRMDGRRREARRSEVSLQYLPYTPFVQYNRAVFERKS